jgi:hypothetical protein
VEETSHLWWEVKGGKGEREREREREIPVSPSRHTPLMVLWETFKNQTIKVFKAEFLDVLHMFTHCPPSLSQLITMSAFLSFRLKTLRVILTPLFLLLPSNLSGRQICLYPTEQGHGFLHALSAGFVC